MLSGKCVVLGVTGGIAAYKAAEIVSRLVKLRARVRVVMTEHACRFVAPLTFETLSGEPAYVDAFARRGEIEHISLAKSADLLLVAPATANILAKAACGLADDLLSTTIAAMSAPVLYAPAMNTAMWKNPANRRNVETLRSFGARFVGPESGRLACGDEDVGRMSEPEAVAEAVKAILLPKRDYEGLHVLVTAGATREPLDPVRFLTNRSTGKMGYAVAEAAEARGARVTLVSGASLPAPQGVTLVPIDTTLALYERVTALAREADVVIQSAAPADYRPAEVAERKIKKTGDTLTVTLVPNPDVAAQLGREKRPGQTLVAFAAETNDLIENARGKLERKNCDLLVANDVTAPGAGFGTDTNVATLVTRDGLEPLPLMSKRELADRILDRVKELRCATRA